MAGHSIESGEIAMSEVSAEVSGDLAAGESSENLEDALSFLERAKKVYSGISLLLNTVQLKALDFDPTQPFSDSTVSLLNVVMFGRCTFMNATL